MGSVFKTLTVVGPIQLLTPQDPSSCGSARALSLQAPLEVGYAWI